MDSPVRSLRRWRLPGSRGLYTVPREVELVDIAADLGISHQALSERLRRGIDALIQDTLMVDDEPAELIR